MRTIEFETQILNGMINIPFPFAAEARGKAKVILLLDELQTEGNKKKKEIMKAFEDARKATIFRKIKNSISWQKKLRNEWK